MLPDSKDLHFVSTKLYVPQPRAGPGKYLMNEIRSGTDVNESRACREADHVLVGLEGPHFLAAQRVQLCPSNLTFLIPFVPLQYACLVPGPGTLGSPFGILLQPLMCLAVYTSGAS